MKLTPVLKGESIQVHVLGGFVHRPAPEDGYAIDVGDTCAFLTAREVELAKVDLGMMKRNGRRR